jgi:hypothetical protein
VTTHDNASQDLKLEVAVIAFESLNPLSKLCYPTLFSFG